MKVILASFSVRPHIDSNNAAPEEEQLALAQDEINSHFSYHTSIRFSDLEIEKAFFETYNCSHFVLGDNGSKLFPVGLYTNDSLFDKEWRKYKFKDALIGHLSNRFRRERFDEYMEKLELCKDPIRIYNYVDTFFKNAWDLQSDGGQTNATLVRKSVVRFASQVSMYVRNGDRIVDLGSSYGSLIWIIVSILNTMGKNVSGEGWEYGVERHKLGTSSTLRMLKDTFAIMPEHRSLLSFSVDLKWRDIFEWQSIGQSNTIAFCFDKVFPPELLLHILLMIINSKQIRLFISCKEIFSRGNHKCKLYSCEFKYADLMQHLNR
jgi:hypothetical protein